MGFFNPTPNHTDAYHKDANGDEYFGKALAGTSTTSSGWQIFKIEYTGSDWIVKYPSGSAAPKFQWDNVANYTYSVLGLGT